jgi:hypothetical protein
MLTDEFMVPDYEKQIFLSLASPHSDYKFRDYSRACPYVFLV